MMEILGMSPAVAGRAAIDRSWAGEVEFPVQRSPGRRRR